MSQNGRKSKQTSDIKLEPDIKQEAKPDIKQEPDIKREPDITQERDVKNEPDIKQEPDIKREPDMEGDVEGPSFVYAVCYVTAVKKHYANDVGVFTKFLSILREAQSERKTLCEIHEKIQVLFCDSPELQAGFEQFIPFECLARLWRCVPLDIQSWIRDAR